MTEGVFRWTHRRLASEAKLAITLCSHRTSCGRDTFEAQVTANVPRLFRGRWRFYVLIRELSRLQT